MRDTALPRETTAQRVARPYDKDSTLDKLDWQLAYVIEMWRASLSSDMLATTIAGMVDSLTILRLMIDRLQEERMGLNKAPAKKWMVFHMAIDVARGIAVCDSIDDALQAANKFIVAADDAKADDDWVVKGSGQHWQRRANNGFLFIVAAPELPAKPLTVYRGDTDSGQIDAPKDDDGWIRNAPRPRLVQDSADDGRLRGNTD